MPLERGEIPVRMAVLEQAHGNHERRLIDVEHEVFGNGKEGLKIRVDRLELSSERTRSTLWRFITPLLPILYAVIFAGIMSVMLDRQQGKIEAIVKQEINGTGRPVK